MMKKNVLREQLPACVPAMVFAVALLGLGAINANARNFRPGQLPNGGVNSCANCHVNPNGGGTRTPFGQAVWAKIGGSSAQIPFWDAALAAMDSDGDGFTNGQELGDPDGDFLNVGPAGAVTNPGDANSKPQANTAPGFTSSPVTTATVGIPYSYQATGFDAEGNGFLFNKGGGPAWISVSAAGLVSGVPPQGSAGNHSITVGITDDGSPPMFGLQNYTLTVSAGNTAPAFTSAPVTIAHIGETYSYQATAFDADGNTLTFSKESGPSWINVSGAGLVGGVPPDGVSGGHAISVKVADNGSPSISALQNYTLAVSASFSGFQNLNFNLPGEAAIAAPDQDPDNDDLPNIVEYALKTNPRAADTLKIPGAPQFDGTGRMQFSLQVRDDDPSLVIRLETGNELPFSAPSIINPVKTDPNGSDGLQTWTFTDTESSGSIMKRFGRLNFDRAP